MLFLLGEFGDWSQWVVIGLHGEIDLDCFSSCGGTRTRTRRCLGPYECIGEDIESEPCPKKPTCTEDLEECTDNNPDDRVMPCYLVKQKGLCHYKTYAERCCRTCTLLGQRLLE